MTNQIDVARIPEDEDYRQELRYRMQTDLFWLTKYILGYNLVSEQWHREVADVFIKKDPARPMNQQSRVRRRILLLPRKTYKALALDTKIPTPAGFTTMGTVKVGDTVFSANGKPCKVIGCSPVFESQTCYKVSFSTGETVIADAGHLWVTDARRDRENGKQWKGKMLSECPRIRSTEELAHTVMIRDERNHRVKLADPLELPDLDLPISPYVLGCWLGDGNKEGQLITLGEGKKALVDEILKEGQIIRYANSSDPYRYVFNGGLEHVEYRMRSGKSFASRIRHLDLYKNKHIPMIYRRASFSQRLALLQGLMDTDGSASRHDGQVVFTNTNRRLCEEIKELILSLGFKATLRGPYEARVNGKNVGKFYHIGFKPYADSKIFRLEQKQRLLRDRKAVSHQNHRTITNVEKIESVPVRCIMVDSPSQMYLVTDGFIPTHNTTFNIADTVQLVLCFPEVAVMVMTASNSPDSPLADAFVGEVASHFYCPEGAPRGPLHLCFPEHVLYKMNKAGEFTTPARSRFRRDPTVKGVSIEQSLSGWHPDWIKSEDVQDNRNSQTSFGLKKVRKNFYLNLKMLGESGFVDITGTRYGPMDLYGDMMQKAGEETILLWKPAYIRRPHALKLDDDELTEEDVILQFPEQLSWEFLRQEKALDSETYWTQYMNVAEGNFVPTFPIEKLEAAKVTEESSYNNDKVHIAWRFEYAECKYAAGAVGIERDGRMLVVEVVRAQLAPSALARRVVGLAKKWETHRAEIEDTPGARSLLPHIRNEALTENWRLEISWGEFLQDETARKFSIKAAEPHLLAGRLLFADALTNSQEVFRQLYHFGIVEEMEIASVVSRLAARLPASIAAEGFEVTDEEGYRAYVEQDAYNRVYGKIDADLEPVPEPEEEWQPAEPAFGLSEWMPGLNG